jgi:hypothetical protein
VSISYTRWRAQLLTNKGGILFLKIVDQFTNTTQQQKDNGEFLLKCMWIEDWSNTPELLYENFIIIPPKLGPPSKVGSP